MPKPSPTHKQSKACWTGRWTKWGHPQQMVTAARGQERDFPKSKLVQQLLFGLGHLTNWDTVCESVEALLLQTSEPPGGSTKLSLALLLDATAGCTIAGGKCVSSTKMLSERERDSA